jgi:hypothetical protein
VGPGGERHRPSTVPGRLPARTARGPPGAGTCSATFGFGRSSADRACLEKELFPLATRDAELVLELEPFRETAYRLLMRAHVGAGNPAEALRVYERCRGLIQEELGVSPSPETEAVYLGIIRTG